MRIAVAQTPGTTYAEWSRTQDTLYELIVQAGQRHADLVVFPEGAWPTYYAESVEAYRRALDAGMPTPEKFFKELGAWAREQSVGVAIGYVEPRGDALVNAMALYSADGYRLGEHVKCFLWDFDRDMFRAGRDIRPIETPWGCVGGMICADARLPEIAATLVTRGAQLLIQPTAWVNVGSPAQPWNPQPDFMLRARAREFGVPTASASKYGREGGTDFVGRSLICDAQGEVLAQAGGDATEIIVADVELGPPDVFPVIAPNHRDRLLADLPPISPKADVPPLHLVEADQPPPEKGPQLSISRDKLLTEPPSFGLRRIDDVVVGMASDEEATSFAPIRCLALAGAHVVVVCGDDACDVTLQTRAMENRIFLVVVDHERVRVIAPSGKFIDAAQPLNIAEAAQKCVANNTDVLADRTPGSYEF